GGRPRIGDFRVQAVAVAVVAGGNPERRQVDLGPGLGFDPNGLERNLVRERRRQDLVSEMRSAREAATLGRVPAVAARVLAARHAEVERGVESIQLLAGELALVVVASSGHRLVERRVVAHDPVLHALREGLDLAEAASLARRGRFERVARAAALAEGLGEDLGHLAPGVREDHVGAERPTERGESITQACLAASIARTGDTGTMVPPAPGPFGGCARAPRRAQPCVSARANLCESEPAPGPPRSKAELREATRRRASARADLRPPTEVQGRAPRGHSTPRVCESEPAAGPPRSKAELREATRRRVSARANLRPAHRGPRPSSARPLA